MLMLRTLAFFLATASAQLSGTLLYRPRPEMRGPFSFPKLFAAALAPYRATMGVLGALLGLLLRFPLAFIPGAVGAFLSARYVRRVTQPHDGFERAFGADWQHEISPEMSSRMLPARWTWWLPDPAEPRWERDVAYWTVPGTDRRLLCDLWQPPPGVKPSGLAFIYMHGSYWHFLDKDVGTRLFFRQLAARGHVVMDVAYRLSPEVELRGMVGDVKRAIAWMKEQGNRFGVDPQRVVVAGGSAGAHLALLAAYAPNHPELTPEELRGRDLSVRGVVSYYGPPDLRAVDVHAGATTGRQGFITGERAGKLGERTPFDWLTAMAMTTVGIGLRKRMTSIQALANLRTRI